LRIKHKPQGAAKNKEIGDPRGGWAGLRPKKDQVPINFSIFFVGFLNSPHRDNPKNVTQKSRKKRFLSDFLSIFWSIFGRFFGKSL
jgi:hypothetical protein